jgi:hypothetical protein
MTQRTLFTVQAGARQVSQPPAPGTWLLPAIDVNAAGAADVPCTLRPTHTRLRHACGYALANAGRGTRANFSTRLQRACQDQLAYRHGKANLRHCSAHGLRKATAAALAEAGATAHEIAAVTGHMSLEEISDTRGPLARRSLLTRLSRSSNDEHSLSHFFQSGTFRAKNSTISKSEFKGGAP